MLCFLIASVPKKHDFIQIKNLIKTCTFTHFGGLGMPSCRSPPFFLFKQEFETKRGMKMSKNYFLFVNGKKILVSEEVYKAYWHVTNHEKYLKRLDQNNHLLFFSNYDLDGHFEDNLVDEAIDIEKIILAKEMIVALKEALSDLNDDEREIVNRLYFQEESICSIAADKKVSHPALIKKRNKILEKLKKLLKDFK